MYAGATNLWRDLVRKFNLPVWKRIMIVKKIITINQIRRVRERGFGWKFLWLTEKKSILILRLCPDEQECQISMIFSECTLGESNNLFIYDFSNAFKRKVAT